MSCCCALGTCWSVCAGKGWWLVRFPLRRVTLDERHAVCAGGYFAYIRMGAVSVRHQRSGELRRVERERAVGRRAAGSCRPHGHATRPRRRAGRARTSGDRHVSRDVARRVPPWVASCDVRRTWRVQGATQGQSVPDVSRHDGPTAVRTGRQPYAAVLTVGGGGDIGSSTPTTSPSHKGTQRRGVHVQDTPRAPPLMRTAAQAANLLLHRRSLHTGNAHTHTVHRHEWLPPAPTPFRAA